MGGGLTFFSGTLYNGSSGVAALRIKGAMISSGEATLRTGGLGFVRGLRTTEYISATFDCEGERSALMGCLRGPDLFGLLTTEYKWLHQIL